MLRGFPKLMLVAGIGMAAAACQDDGAQPRGYYQPAPGNQYYNSGYYQPAPSYGNQYYNNGYYNPPPAQRNGWYNQGDGRRYTTVTVTNRGQNGYRDDVVQQQVVCGSQYYDGYRTRTARC